MGPIYLDFATVGCGWKKFPKKYSPKWWLFDGDESHGTFSEKDHLKNRNPRSLDQQDGPLLVINGAISPINGLK